MGEFLTVNEKVECAKRAEKYGLSSAWVAEHHYHRDAVVTCTAILSETRTMYVGTSIINPFTRHPALLAMTAATLNEFSGGRFVLGLGLGIPLWNEEQMGIPMGKDPVNSLKEAVAITRSLLRGETTRLEGRRFTARNVKLGFDLGKNPSRVYVAAVRPKLLKTAAQIGDGVILPACSTVSYIKNSLPFINQGMRESGRNAVEVVCLAYLSISKESQLATHEIKPRLFTILMRPDREELIFPDELDRQAEVKAAKTALAQGDTEKAMNLISDDIVKTVSITGDLNECFAGIDRFRNTGVTELVLVPTNADLSYLEELLSRLSHSNIG